MKRKEMDIEKQMDRISITRGFYGDYKEIIESWHIRQCFKVSSQIKFFLFGNKEKLLVILTLRMIDTILSVLDILNAKLENDDEKNDVSLEEIDKEIYRLRTQFKELVKYSKYPYSIKCINVD